MDVRGEPQPLPPPRARRERHPAAARRDQYRGRIRAEPVLDGAGRLGPAAREPGPLPSRARHPGAGPCRAPLLDAVRSAGRPGDRLHPVRARDLELVPERDPPRLRGGVLPVPADESFLQSGPHRSSRHPHLSRRGERADVPGGRRGGGRISRPPDAFRRVPPGRRKGRNRGGARARTGGTARSSNSTLRSSPSPARRRRNAPRPSRKSGARSRSTPRLRTTGRSSNTTSSAASERS